MRNAPMPGWFWPAFIVSGTLTLFLWLDKKNKELS